MALKTFITDKYQNQVGHLSPQTHPCSLLCVHAACTEPFCVPGVGAVLSDSGAWLHSSQRHLWAGMTVWHTPAGRCVVVVAGLQAWPACAEAAQLCSGLSCCGCIA